ncbi:MAG: hypothetical protein NC311_17085 [Muribaculaceae bacterium]|nr:hypothetical protein [Muribaculaceae bacterium]
MSNKLKEAENFKFLLTEFVNNVIENNATIRAAIKAKKAVVVEAANTAEKTVKVQFPFDNTTLTLPYNPKIPLECLAVGKAVSVWYSQSLNNGIVMQNGSWTA